MLLTSIADAQPAYDAVVIGAGLGGMTAAKRLADSGRKTLLLEAHTMLGGYATWFRRRGHIFDVALHAFPWGVAKTFRKYWSRDLAERVIPIPRLRYENPEFAIQTTFAADDFKRLLKERFSVPEAQSEAFFKACREMDFFRPNAETTRDFLERHFPGRRDVTRLLLETVTYATGTNLDDPAVVYAIIFSNFAQKGTCTFQGGTDLLLSEMQRLMLESGVDIALRTRVEKIIVKNGAAAGVIANGREITARAVVSNANLKATILDLAGVDAVPAPFAETCRELPLSVSVAQVYYGLKKGETIPEIADILFASDVPHYDAAAFRAFPPRSASFSFYYPKTLRPDHDATEIVATVCADYEDWDNLSEQEYRDKKNVLIDAVTGILSRYIPGIAGMCDHVEAATPKTLERYTGHWRGATFGTKFPGFAAAAELPGRIPGLFHCGAQGIIMSGWLGSANSGALAAGKVEAYLDSITKE